MNRALRQLPTVQSSPTHSQLTWVKASSSYGNGECIELSADGETVLLRDSKDPSGPWLRFTKRELSAFLQAAGEGEFDHLAH